MDSFTIVTADIVNWYPPQIPVRHVKEIGQPNCGVRQDLCPNRLCQDCDSRSTAQVSCAFKIATQVSIHSNSDIASRHKHSASINTCFVDNTTVEWVLQVNR